MTTMRERILFIRDLREMAQQLERDDWIETFDQNFGQIEYHKKLSTKNNTSNVSKFGAILAVAFCDLNNLRGHPQRIIQLRDKF